MTLTVICVLKSGGIYGPEWVEKLQHAVMAHLSRRHRFICLSDLEIPCERFRLLHDWPGWWSKIELFAPGVFSGPRLYIDLDTIITAPLDDMIPATGFHMVQDYVHGRGRHNSTCMYLDRDYPEVYETFRADPEGHMRRYDKERPKGRVGDQAFIEDVFSATGTPIRTWPMGKVVSFKKHARKGPPEGAVMVAAHGKPKPHDPRAGWLHEAWSAL